MARQGIHKSGNGGRPLCIGLAPLLIALVGCGSAQDPETTPVATPVATPAATSDAGEPGRPHVVLLVADDLGWGDVGYHGSEIRTPTLDELAARGVRLNQFYALQTCTPSRAALLTGRFPMRFGLQVGIVWKESEYGLLPEERTLAEALGEAGYETAICGKWHLGHHDPAMRPGGQGFEHQYGSYLASGGYFDRMRKRELDWFRDDQPLTEAGYTTDLIAAEAVRRIGERDETRPLFLFVSFTAPHMPLEAPAEYIQRYAHLTDPDRAIYAAMVECMDSGIQRILDALDAADMTDDTLVIFLSDNGAAQYHAGSNAPLRGGKQTLYEGGVRVPALAVWPGKLPAGRVIDELLHLTDWYPTLLALAGAPTRQDLVVDGRDIWPVLADGEPSPHEEILINYYLPGTGAIRRGRWKLYVDEEHGPRPPELFDLEQDPGELTNLASEHPEIVQDLRARLEVYAAQSVPSIPRVTREDFRDEKNERKTRRGERGDR